MLSFYAAEALPVAGDAERGPWHPGEV